MKVWVVPFAPAREENCVGGFEWRFNREDAVTELLDLISNDDPGHAYKFFAVDVPDGLSNDDITAWLDANDDVIFSVAHEEESLRLIVERH